MENLKYAMRQMFEQRNTAEWADHETRIMDDTIGKIINLSILNPSAFEGQLWEIVAVKSQKSKYMLYKLLGGDDKVIQASTALILINNAKDNFFPLAHMSIMYAAKYYGIDFYPISEIDFEPLKAAFNIPTSKQVIMIACLGHFDDVPFVYSLQNRLCYRDIVQEI